MYPDGAGRRSQLVFPKLKNKCWKVGGPGGRPERRHDRRHEVSWCLGRRHSNTEVDDWPGWPLVGGNKPKKKKKPERLLVSPPPVCSEVTCAESTLTFLIHVSD